MRGNGELDPARRYSVFKYSRTARFWSSLSLSGMCARRHSCRSSKYRNTAGVRHSIALARAGDQKPQFQSDPLPIVSIVAFSSPNAGTIRRVQHVPERGYRAVVKRRRACPNAVQRGCDVPAGFLNNRWLVVIGKPALAISVPMFGGYASSAHGRFALRRWGLASRDSGHSRRMCRGMRCSFSEKRARRSMPTPYRSARGRSAGERLQICVDVGKVLFPKTEFLRTVLFDQQKLHQRPGTFRCKAIDVKHFFLVNVPPRHAS